MPQWDEFHGWMKFRYLDDDEGLTRAFTIGYRFTDDAAEEWTARFNRFKANARPALYGGLEMMKAAVPGLVRGLELDPASTMFVPALSSSETIASGSGVLGVLTYHCAEAAGAGFTRDAISKQSHQSLHNVGSADRRREILDEASFQAQRIRADSVMVFDDFVTTGNTLSHIATAILHSNPEITVYGVGLSKTERRNYHRERFNVELSNDHVPQAWEDAWNTGESR